MGDLKGVGLFAAALAAVGLVLAPPVDLALDLLCLRALMTGHMGPTRFKIIAWAALFEVALPAWLLVSAPRETIEWVGAWDQPWKSIAIFFFASGLFKGVVLVRLLARRYLPVRP